MSKYAYIQECQFCGKLFKFPTKLKYCSEDCRIKAFQYMKNLKRKNSDVNIDTAMKIHRSERLNPKKEEVSQTERRNPFLRAGNKILFPVRYTSGATRWEWVNIENIEKGVRII